MRKRRILAFLLVLAMLLSTVPVQSLAGTAGDEDELQAEGQYYTDVVQDDSQDTEQPDLDAGYKESQAGEPFKVDAVNEEQLTDEQLKEKLKASVDENEYPNGLFEFLTTRMNTSEDLSYVEFAIVRKGGTAGAAGITLKAIDVTAEYGKDYTLSVPTDTSFETIPENDESKPLIESTVEIYDESLPATDGEESALNDETAAENVNGEAITSRNSEEFETIAGPALEEDSANGLRGARDAALGKESTRQNWRQITETEKKSALDSHKEMYADVAGVTCTINFADGEYIKKIRFNTIDDQISEDEEQVMMALVSPQGGVTGDSLNAFMNIVDNEAKETVLFAMQDSEVESDPSTGYAAVTVKRTAGLYRYGLINVGTAALSAEPEVDYKPVMTELRFIPGQETQTVKIPIISGSSGEELQFCVKLDPESPNLSAGEATQTIVTIKPSTKYLMQASGDISNMTSSDTSLFSSLSTITPQATEGIEFESGKNYRVKTLSVYDMAGYKNYAIVAGPCAYIPISSQNDSNWIYYNADLTMVEKIKFDWFNPCTGEYKGWGWINPAYYQTFNTYMQIRGDTKVVHTGKFPSQWEEYILSDLDRQPTSIKFMTQTFGDARSSELYVGNVKLYYIPVKIRLKTLLDDPDANIIPKTWTATGNSADGKKVYAGQLAFANDTSVDEKTFYDGDTVYLAPKFASSDLDTSKVYLWGYKIEKVGGGYYYIQGDSLNIRNAYAGALRDINGSYIPRSQILMNNNQIVLLPVYKARNAFVKINFDREKGGMVNNSYTSGETMKIGMLDTVKCNAFANDGYYVSGYDHLNINYEGNVITSNAMERSMESWSPQSAENAMQTYFSGVYLGMAEPVADIAINPAVPNELDFKPQKNFTNLTVQYSVPFLTAKVDPKSGSKTKGAVAYFPETGEPQVGNSTTPLVISPIKRNQAYILSGDPDEGYRMLWKDWTGDINEDGVISQEEADDIKDYEDLFERKAVAGNFYNYVVNYDKPLIYYSFEPKPTGGDPGLVTGKVVLVGGNVLNNTGTASVGTVTKPLAGVSVIINGHSLETDAQGRFSLEHLDFTTNEYHSMVVNYRGINYTGYINVNFFTVIKILEYDSFIPYNFAAFEGENKLDLRAIGNKDAEYTFRFDVTSRKSGLSAAKALVRIYSKEGVQRGTPIEVVPEAGAYVFTLNPAATGVVPGDTMTLQMVDQNGIAYLEHNVGFAFIKYLSTFSLLTSFKSPASGVIDMVGSIDAAFDLGLAGQADKYMKKNNQEWIIAFGFTKDWEKSLYDSSENEEAGDTGQESAESKLKNAAKSTDTQKTKDVAANAVDENNKEKKSANLTAGMNFGLSTSLYLRMIVDDDPDSEHYGDAYFNEMILSAKLTGSFSTKVEIQTPVGVTVFVGLEMGGDVTAMMVVEQYDYKKFYFNDNGEIDFSRAGDSDPDRDFTIYGKFMVNPYIKIMVGAEMPLVTLTIDGRAAFDMNFTTTGSGRGSVTLSSSMTLKVACFEFGWQIANKTWDLFNYGGQLRSLNANQLFGDSSYLYDSAENREVASRDYLDNRGAWQGGSGSERIKALALDSSTGNEQILQTGVYPYPYTLLADIGANQQLLVFLDDDVTHDDKNRTQLYYSIHTGDTWSVPQKLDDDNTPDLMPCIYDLGDSVLVAWSSAYTMIGDDDTTIQVLNNNNIKASFFDKNSQTFGQVQEVTRQTQEDIYSDANPYIAYWKDGAGQENLMIVYTKSEYRASVNENDQDAVVGDIINPYYTTLAYRFYDFNNGQWEDSGTDMDGYYGQNFIDASEYVEVNASNLLIHESEDLAWAGYWSRVPTEDEISIKSFANNDPLILDSDAIGCEGYAVLAYSIDLDSDTSTTSDRELYIQLYDFEKRVFFPPIRCTDDDEGLSNLVFDQSNDNVYLYYLTDGDIHCIDVGYLISQNLLYYVVAGPDNEDQGVFVVNKIKNLYRKPEVVVKHKYELRTDSDGNQVKENEQPIDEFMVESDDNNVYIVWGENDMTYRDGIDPNSAEAALPENNFREHQIYIVRQTIGELTETLFYQEDGVTPATYPAVDEQGETIDYSEFVDINNQVGEVQAGDPIISRYRPTQWSEQVKLTDEKGANFNDLDFVILPDGNLRVVFVKGMSEVMDVAGMPMAVENINNRTLMTADFNINKEKAEVSIEPVDRLQPKEVVPVIINLKNLGLVPLDNLEVELLQVSAGESQTMETQNIVKLKGGEQTSLVMSWQAPEDLAGIKLNVMVKHDGEVLGNAETIIETASAVEVTGVKTDFVDRNRLRITGFAVNNGNISATNAIIYAETGGMTIGTINLGNLDVGKTQYFEFYGELQAVQFESTIGDDGSLTGSLKLSVHADGTGESVTCERYASAEEMELMNNISSFGLKSEDSPVNDAITIKSGSSISILPVLEYENDELAVPRVEYFSSNTEVADFSKDNVTLNAKTAGTTTITAYVLPPENQLNLSEKGFSWDDNLNTLPNEAMKVKRFTVNVASGGGHTSSGGSAGSPARASGSETSAAGNMVTAIMKAAVTKGSDGTIKASVSADQIQAAVNQAVGQAVIQGENKSAGIKINVQASADTAKVETTLPKEGLGAARNAGIAALSISTPVGSLTFDQEALTTLYDAAGEDIKIAVSRLDAFKLAPAARQIVGDRPVYEFNVTSSDKAITQFGGQVTVSVSYIPKEGEDTEAIVIYYINTAGEPVMVSNCVYDSASGTITFATDHFSTYAVGYNKIFFTDVAEDAWYSQAVSFAAARGITSGTGNNLYQPDAALTRAQFMVMAMRANNILPDDNPKNNFTDAGNAYYTGYLSAAKSLGIAKGVGDNLFAPGGKITRQEMAALLYNALQMLKKLPTGTSDKTMEDFRDADLIAPWAEEAMIKLVETGVINGSNGEIRPTDVVSRAQIAQVLYNLMHNEK